MPPTSLPIPAMGVLMLSLQPCPTLCNTMDCSLPGSSVLGILQARILKLLCPPPGDLPDPGIEPVCLMSPALAGRFFTTSTTWEAPVLVIGGSQVKPTRLSSSK